MRGAEQGALAARPRATPAHGNRHSLLEPRRAVVLTSPAHPRFGRARLMPTCADCPRSQAKEMKKFKAAGHYTVGPYPRSSRNPCSFGVLRLVGSLVRAQVPSSPWPYVLEP